MNEIVISSDFDQVRFHRGLIGIVQMLVSLSFTSILLYLLGYLKNKYSFFFK